MRSKLRFVLPLLLFFVLAFPASQPLAQTPGGSALTVDEIVRRHVETLGGIDKLRAVQSLRYTGKALFQGGLIEAPAVLQFKRPGLLRMDVSLHGVTMVQAFDGTAGWEINPFEGSMQPRRTSEEESSDLQDDADIDGPLVDYKSKGHTVELVGREDLEGKPVYKLKVSARNGEVSYLYLDAASFLLVRETQRSKVQGVEVDVESNLGDYKPVNGVMRPFALTHKINGRTMTQLIIDKIEANVALDSTIFKMPAQSPAADKPQSAPQQTPAKPPVKTSGSKRGAE